MTKTYKVRYTNGPSYDEHTVTCTDINVGERMIYFFNKSELVFAISVYNLIFYRLIRD